MEMTAVFVGLLYLQVVEGAGLDVRVGSKVVSSLMHSSARIRG